MYNYVLFWISYLLFALRLIWFLKRLFRDQDTPSRACKTRSGGAKPIIPTYVENNYRIEVKITFILTAYLVLYCEFFWEFSIFHFFRPLVAIYRHPPLSVIQILTLNELKTLKAANRLWKWNVASSSSIFRHYQHCQTTRFVVNIAVESSSKLLQFNKMSDCLK